MRYNIIINRIKRAIEDARSVVLNKEWFKEGYIGKDKEYYTKLEEHYDQMIQYNIVDEQYMPDVVQFEGKERPPMIEIPEYCKKYHLAE